MTRWKVLVTNPVAPATHATLAAHAEVLTPPDATPETLRRFASDVHLIVVRLPLPDDIFEHAPKVLGVVRHGVGLDLIPVEAATAKGILVTNVPGGNADSVAEFCVMQMLNLLRRPALGDRLIREAGWEVARAATTHGKELAGRTVGILGYGAIGRRLAEILHFGFRAKVAVNTRRPHDLPEWARPLPIEPLVAGCDFVVPCLPYTKDTHRYLSAQLIARIKPTAWVVNASRGEVIDEPALFEALRAGRIAGAALDVFDGKALPAGHPALDVPNLLMTPHVAGHTDEASARVGAHAAAEALRILAGERPHSLANPEAWAYHAGRRRDVLGT